MKKRKSKNEVKEEKIKLTNPEHIKEFQRAALATWQSIGYDLIKCFAETDDISMSIAKDVVIESVLDAGYILQYGGIKSPEVINYYNHGDYDQMIDLCKEVFKFKTYGL
jgi:hypothetical protein